MSGANDYHTGEGIAYGLERKDKRLQVEKSDTARNCLTISDENGNRLTIHGGYVPPKEFNHIKAMVKKLFGITLIILLVLMIYASNFA